MKLVQSMVSIALMGSFVACASSGSSQNPAPVASSATSETQASGDLVAVASSNGKFSTLVKALQEADLVGTLQGEGPFTVFAPTDEAFAKLPAGTLDSLLADKEKLRMVLTYHVVPGRVTASQVVGLDKASTVAGQDLSVTNDGGVMVNEAHVVQTDVMASNGVIHVIDTVLIPTEAPASAQ